MNHNQLNFYILDNNTLLTLPSAYSSRLKCSLCKFHFHCCLKCNSFNTLLDRNQNGCKLTYTVHAQSLGLTA